MLSFLWKDSPLGGLTKFSFASMTGRNGQILVRHRANPYHKRKLRLLNGKAFLLKRGLAQVVRIERDPNRSAFIGLCRFLNSGFLSYLPVSSNTVPGSFIRINPSRNEMSHWYATERDQIEVLSPLYSLPKGTLVNNISSRRFSSFTFCRAAGAKAKILSLSANKEMAALLLPSGKTIYVDSRAYAFTGINSNPSNFLDKKVKAGQTRHTGIRPTVRGVAMNPVDHPMGGGEGKSSGGRASVSPWGKLTKGGFRTINKVQRMRQLAIKKIFNKI